MMSLAIGSMMQLTSQNWFTRSFSDNYKMIDGSRVCKLIFKNALSCPHVECNFRPVHSKFFLIRAVCFLLRVYRDFVKKTACA